MKKLVLVITCFLSACASAPTMTKELSPTMSIIVYSESLSEAQYSNLVSSLMESGKWRILDRATGFRGANFEQNLVHQEASDRFEDREKIALWAKMRGGGGVIVASESCQEARNMWGGYYQKCRQNLSLIDATTTEIIASISNKTENDDLYLPSIWDDSVEKFNKSIPKDYKGDDLEKRRAVAADEAKKVKKYENRE